MKLSATRALGAIALIAGLTTLSPSAHAQTLVLTCNAAQAHPTDSDIIIENHEATDGPCTISVPLNPKHALVIDADGPVITQAITLQPASSANGTALFGSYGNIWIKTPNTVKTGAIKATPVVESGGGYIAIQAGGTVSTGAITTSLGGWIDIQAQMNGGNLPFVIGTTGTNGVGKISTSGNNLSQQSGRSYLLQTSAVVNIINGAVGSTGGISLTAATSISAPSGGGSRGTGIILDARNGPIHIPAGTINVSSSTSSTPAVVGGGQIDLLANEIDFSGTVTLNANSGASAGPFNNQINLSASKISYGTLTLEADGNGVAANPPSIPSAFPSSVGIYSQGIFTNTVTTIADGNGELNTINVTVANSDAESGPLTLTGTGALTAHASGDVSEVAVVGKGFAFGGTNVSLTSNGAVSHGIYLSNNAADSSITFGNSGTVTLTANGLANPYSQTTTGGYIYVESDALALNAKTFVISANGPSSGAGDGGIVAIETKSLSQGTGFLGAKISANGAPAGNGNAQRTLVVPELDPVRQFPAIFLDAGQGVNSSLTFGTGTAKATPYNGTATGTFNLSANGGKTGGQGGAILLTADSHNVETASSINASALGGNDSGGQVTFSGGQLTDVTAGVSTLIKATGFGTGHGGTVIANYHGISFDPVFNFKVDGGTKVPASAVDGILTLNQITCQQWYVQATWPKTYWDCINPSSPQDREKIPFNFASTNPGVQGLKATYLAANTNLFVFDTATSSTTFLNAQVSADTNANTVKLVPSNAAMTLYVQLFLDSGYNGTDTPLTEINLNEITAHELGHAYDIAKKYPSAVAPFQSYSLVDFLTLDYAALGTSRATSLQRDPCNGAGAPFATAVDFNGQPVCIPDGQGNLKLRDSGLVGVVNSSIAYALRTLIFSPKSEDPADALVGPYRELYAQEFAYRTYAGTLSPSQFTDTISDNVFLSGEFPCTQGLQDTLVGGTFKPPATCKTTKIPAWYKPFADTK
jgi:hypothetical protein